MQCVSLEGHCFVLSICQSAQKKDRLAGYAVRTPKVVPHERHDQRE